MSAVATKLITAEEFGRMPEPPDGSREELVKGVIVTMPPPKGRHGFVQLTIGAMLLAFVKANRLGWVVTESGTIVERGPDTVRGPDVSFYSLAGCPELPDGYFATPPDLVVEILSPSDRRSAVREKVREYIAAGTREVWVADPETRTVMVYRGTLRGAEYDEADTLDGGDVLPGFACRVGDLFA